MRVYRRKAFLELPAGTIYAKGVRWAFNGFSIKAETLGNDWVCLDPMWIEASSDLDADNKLEGMLERGESYPMKESYGRDGYFDDDDIFLVPEKADLEFLQELINEAIAACSLMEK